MYKESKESVDSDIIDIDIENKDVSFIYNEEPTASDYSGQLKAMLSRLNLYYTLFFFLFSILSGFLYQTLSYSLTNSLMPILYPIAFLIGICFFDIVFFLVGRYAYYFDKTLISKIHKFLFNLSERFEKPEIEYLIAKKKIEKIYISHPTFGFIWDSKGEHRKYLDKIIFYHEKSDKFQANIPKVWFKNTRRLYKRPTLFVRAMLELHFRKIPKTGLIKLKSY